MLLYIYGESDIYIMLMLQLYKCTTIYIVQYRQSIAFGNIYIGGHLSVAHEGESHKSTTESRTSRRLSSAPVNYTRQCCED